MADIDIGAAAVNRSESTSLIFTQIGKENSANDTGIITVVEVWLNSQCTEFQAFTAIDEGSNVLSSRDYENLGVTWAGSKKIFSGLNMDVETGDYLGCSTEGGGSVGATERANSGEGYWTLEAKNILPISSVGFSFGSGRTISLYGEGTFPAPDPPTNVAATENQSDKSVITWTKSDGATKYEVFRDGGGLGELGDVATYDDTEADAPTITPGTGAATDGETTGVTLSLSGESANNGTTHTYTVKAWNENGWSDASGSDTGYRDVGSLTYQWQISAGDSDADYGNISGGTTEPYNHEVAHIDGRYYRCYETATGASPATSAVDRGWRKPLGVADGDLIARGVITKGVTVALVPGSSAYPEGYHTGNVGGLVAIDGDFVEGNIADGVEIFGVTGTVVAGISFTSYYWEDELSSGTTYTPPTHSQGLFMSNLYKMIANEVHVEFWDGGAWISAHPTIIAVEDWCIVFQDTAQSLRVINTIATPYWLRLSGVIWAGYSSDYHYYEDLAQNVTYTPPANSISSLFSEDGKNANDNLGIYSYIDSSWKFTGINLSSSMLILQDSAQKLKIEKAAPGEIKISLTGVLW